MNTNVCKELINFTQRYIDAWQTHHCHGSKSNALFDVRSECVLDVQDESVFWMPVQRTKPMSFNAAESRMKWTFHPDVKSWFGTQLADDMKASFQGLSFWVLQVWNDADFTRLLSNQMAHLAMQKRLKRPATFFLETLMDDTHIITLHTASGQVIIADLIEGHHSSVWPSSDECFLMQLKPECDS